MDANALGTRLTEAFSDSTPWAARSAKRLYVSIEPAMLYPVFDWLTAEVPGLRFGTTTGMDLREGVGIFHHLLINGSPLVITLKAVAAKPDPSIPSLAARVPAAAWIEREVTDMLGVVFEGHPEPYSLIKAEAFAEDYPMRRDFDVAQFKEDIGELPDF
jgi:Ni,Fe-hydrogenase III component G